MTEQNSIGHRQEKQPDRDGVRTDNACVYQIFRGNIKLRTPGYHRNFGMPPEAGNFEDGN